MKINLMQPIHNRVGGEQTVGQILCDLLDAGFGLSDVERIKAVVLAEKMGSGYDDLTQPQADLLKKTFKAAPSQAWITAAIVFHVWPEDLEAEDRAILAQRFLAFAPAVS